MNLKCIVFHSEMSVISKWIETVMCSSMDQAYSYFLWVHTKWTYHTVLPPVQNRNKRRFPFLDFPYMLLSGIVWYRTGSLHLLFPQTSPTPALWAIMAFRIGFHSGLRYRRITLLSEHAWNSEIWRGRRWQETRRKTTDSKHTIKRAFKIVLLITL